MVDVGSFADDLSSSNYIEIFDTTLRDGSQTPNVNLTLEDKLDIAEKLDGMVDYIEGGWPFSNPKDKKFFEQVSVNKSELVAFGMTAKNNVNRDRNLKAIADSNARVACMVAKSWDLHVKDVLNISLGENLEKIKESIGFLKNNGLEVFVDLEHYFDSYIGNKNYLSEIFSCLEGADKLILCDTNGGAMPNTIKRAVEFAQTNSNVDLGVHMHNDSGLALANSILAVNNGVEHVQGTVNGLGERCGNLDLCQIIPILKLKMDKNLITNVKQIKGLSYFVERLTNFKLGKNHPFTGENAFKHKAGLHVDAIRKNKKTYEHMDPKKIGQKRTFHLSEQAGRANIVMLAKEHGYIIDKNNTVTKELLEKVKNKGYVGDSELFLLMAKKIDGLEAPFDLKGYSITINQRGKDVAKIKISLNGKTIDKTASGVGPVHALDKALRSSLDKLGIKKVNLSNYKVRILNEEKGTGAVVEVLIEFKSNGNKWYTSAVSADIIKASKKALVNGYKYYLVKKKKGDFE